MKREIPNMLLMAEVERQLREGRQVVIAAKGRSMRPYIKEGRDNLVFSPISPHDIKVGHVVLARMADGSCLAHRVVKAGEHKLLLMGDGNVQGTELCTRADVLGLLSAVERGGKRIDCNTPAQMRKAALLRAPYRLYLRLRGLAGKCLRAVTGRKRPAPSRK